MIFKARVDQGVEAQMISVIKNMADTLQEMEGITPEVDHPPMKKTVLWSMRNIGEDIISPSEMIMICGDMTEKR